MDARVKTIFTLVFIVFVNLVPSKAWSSYILFCALIVSILLLSLIPAKKVLLRSLIGLPFILAALPLVFTAGEPWLQLRISEKSSVLISQPGLFQLIGISLKSWLSILAAILLTYSTSFSELMRAFLQLGLPQTLVAIFSLMWRYLGLLITEAENLMCARNSRSGYSMKTRTPHAPIWWQAQVTGKMAGNLFLRSIERSERVYASMAARGYNGELPDIKREPLLAREIFVLISTIVILLAILTTGFLFY